MARKKKDIRCVCSSFNIRKPDPEDVIEARKRAKGFKNPRVEPRVEFDKCECAVDGKNVTKIGRDDVSVEINLELDNGQEQISCSQKRF